MKIYSPPDTLLHDIDVDDSSVRYRAIMTDDSLTLNFSTTHYIEIPVGAFVNFEGSRYTLYRREDFKKKNIRNFEYTLVLHGYCELLKVVRFKDISAQPYRLKFSLTATPREFLDILTYNLNMFTTVWIVGNCIEAPARTLSFNHENCLDVLNRLAQEFNTEFEFEGKKIHFRKIEYNKENPLPLSYGKGNGFLPDVGRYSDGDKRPIKSLFVQGGERNIDFSKYKSKTLLLPKSASLDYNGKTYRTDPNGIYIYRNNGNVAEDSYDASAIYPHRVGTVSEVIVVDAAKHSYDIKDASIPATLDYAACRIAGEKATIKFESGALAGREFDIEQTDTALTGYIHAEKRFKIVPQEIDGVVMPGSVFIPAVGDKYAIFNVALPQAYIQDDATKTGASWDMFREAVRYFAENETDKFRFTGKLDGVWSKSRWLEIGGKIVPGGYIDFSDTQFQTTPVPIRIVAIKDYINKPHKPEITLSNAPVSASFSAGLAKLEADEVVIEDAKDAAIRFSKRQWRDARETMEMLQSSLLNFSGSINPLTVQTMQAIVGDESLQFRFVNSKTTPVQVSHAFTFNAATDKFSVVAGILQHMSVGIKSVSNFHATTEYKFWDMASYTSPALTDTKKAYYCYAKCSKTATTGVFLLSETSIKMEDVAGYYHFLCGILNSENGGGSRSFAPLYGFTEILPGRITTDKIVSNDGKTYFDLISGIIAGKIKFISSDTEVDLETWANDTDMGIANAQNVAGNAAIEAQNALHKAANALAKAVENEAKTQFQTVIDGGLIYTALMKLFDSGTGSETAFISGKQGAGGLPAFGAGGSYDDALSNIAKIILRHDGTGRIGILDINSEGDVTVYDDNGVERFSIRKSNLLSLAELIAQGTFTLTEEQSSFVSTTDNTVIVPGMAMQVTKPGGSLHVQGLLKAYIEVQNMQQDAAGTSAQVLLYRDGKHHATLFATTIVKYPQDGSPTPFKESIVNGQEQISVEPGYYTVRLHVERTVYAGNNSTSSGSLGSGKMTWTLNTSQYRRINFGKNGMLMAYPDMHLYYSQETGLDVKGKTNMPGVLAAGSSTSGGTQTNVWGAKSNAGGVTPISGGFRVPLNEMSYSNYVVQITPHTNSTFRVGTKTSAYFEIYGSGGFDYVVIGKNYNA